MRMRTVLVTMLLLVSLIAGSVVIFGNNQASSAMAPVTRYVGGGDSTYDTIQDAIDDAGDGDTIIIADGDYGEDQLSIVKDNLLIQGNTTGNGVRVTSSISGPCLFLQSVTNVTIRYVNFSHSSNAARVYDSDNITFEACVFWSTGGTSGSLFVDNSENVTVMGDLWGGVIAKIHSEGDNNPSIKIDSSKFVGTYLSELESDGSKAHNIACYGNSQFIGASFASFLAAGPISTSFYAGGSINAMLIGVETNYTDKMIIINSGYMETMDMDVPDANISVGSDGVLKCIYERIVQVTDEDRMAVEDVDIQVTNEYDGIVYETAKWGGSDPATDEWGETNYIPFLTKVFQGSNSPNYGENVVRAFYDGGDRMVSTARGNVDANTTDPFLLELNDFEAPDDPSNVEAETVAHDRIDLSFDASLASDLDHYEVWVDPGTGFIRDFNTTEAGRFPYLGLTPDTEYSFRVIAVDDDGLSSTGVEVSNTTMPPVNGTIHGKVSYSGGPMAGLPADGATVTVMNETLESLMFTTVNETGFYILEDVPFGSDYTMKVDPVDPVEDMGTESGYISWEWEFDHTDDMVKNISLAYYEYDSDDIFGEAVYSGGPMDGMNATNLTVVLFNETMVEIKNTTTNITTGEYKFEDVAFGENYTIEVTPGDAVLEGGTQSGYPEYTMKFDHTGLLEINITMDYYLYDSDDILGHAYYFGGSSDGENVGNATVIIYNETMVEISNTTTNATTGMFILEDVPFGINYTLKVTPVDAVIDGGEESGYVMNITGPFDHDGMRAMDINIEYYTSSSPQPSTGTITGKVTFEGGDKDGNVSAGSRVSLIASGGEYTNTTTNETGEYIFEDVAFGDYRIEFHPVAADLGETEVRSGYLPDTIPEFTLDSEGTTVKDGVLEYYEYEEPAPVKPSVTILDENGDPIDGVKVTANVNGTTYEAVTNEDGVATFDYDGEDFPSGTTFKAEKDGFETIEWEQGDSVPEMKEDTEDNTLMFILIAVILIIVIIVIFLLVRNRGKEEEHFDDWAEE